MCSTTGCRGQSANGALGTRLGGLFCNGIYKVVVFGAILGISVDTEVLRQDLDDAVTCDYFSDQVAISSAHCHRYSDTKSFTFSQPFDYSCKKRVVFYKKKTFLHLQPSKLPILAEIKT